MRKWTKNHNNRCTGGEGGEEIRNHSTAYGYPYMTVNAKWKAIPNVRVI